MLIKVGRSNVISKERRDGTWEKKNDVRLKMDAYDAGDVKQRKEI